MTTISGISFSKQWVSAPEKRWNTPRYGFLLDMETVLFDGCKLRPEAAEFVAGLLRHGVPFQLITNAGGSRVQQQMHAFAACGVTLNDSRVYSGTDATIEFLCRGGRPPSVYPIGDGPMLNALQSAGITITSILPDCVVVSEGRTVFYDMLERAQNLIAAGAALVTTSRTCRYSDGDRLQLGCGTMVTALECATGAVARCVGFPSTYALRSARKRMRVPTPQTVVVSTSADMLYQAMEMGFNTVRIGPPGTAAETAAAMPPDFACASLADLDLDSLALLVTTRILQEENAMYGNLMPD